MILPWHHETDTFRIRKLCVGPYENNAYVVACRTTSQAVLVDAAAEVDRLLAGTGDVSVSAILTTHGHFDHVGAARATADRLGVPLRLHLADEELAGLKPDEPLQPGTIRVGELDVEVVPTPGHTPGSVSLLLDGVALTGDTLFPGGPGATHGARSSFDEIIRSIEAHLLPLPGDTLVMPGHGLDTTIAAEAPSLTNWIERGW